MAREFKYAVLMQSKEARTATDTLVTSEGDWFLVEDEPEGWVEATSGRGRDVTRNAKLFDSPVEAEAFARRWKGHPWWCIPNGKFEVVPVEQKRAVNYDQLAAENARLREALERIAKDSPTEEPSREFTGNSDDDYHAGSDHLHWWYGRIAREALSPAPAKKENERG